MEITGTVKSLHSGFFRIVTEDNKMQEIDIFYTASRRDDVKDFIVRELVILSVQLQSVDFEGSKLAKLWLLSVIYPKIVIKDSRRTKGEGDRDWGNSRRQ